MPRKAGVSGRTTMRFIFFNPSDRTITLCFSGEQIGLPISLILMVAAGHGLAHLLQRQAAHIGHLRPVAQLLQRVDGGFHHVVRIVRADAIWSARW